MNDDNLQNNLSQGNQSGMNSSGSTANLQSYLESVQFPASKADVVSSLRDSGASESLIQRVERMPVNEFNSTSEITDAMGGSESSGTGNSGGSGIDEIGASMTGNELDDDM